MFGKLLSYKLEANILKLEFKNKNGYLVFINDKIVNVTESFDTKSFAVSQLSLKETKLNIKQDNKYLEIKTAALKITISDDFKVDFYTLDNKEICLEYQDEIIKMEEDVDTSLAALEGHAVLDKINEFNVFIRKKLHDDEAFYGLGDKMGFTNKRGYDYITWNTDDPSTQTEFYRALYKSVPFMIGLHGGLTYGIFFDNTYKTFFDLGKTSTDYFSFSAVDGKLNYYFMYGEDIKEVVNQYTTLTGKTPLPQIWTLGSHQSRWSYPNEEEVMRIAEGYINHDLPLDVIHLDIDYMERYKIFTVSDERFPNFKELINRLAKQGIKIVTIIDPGTKVEDGYDVYEEGIKNGYFAFDKDGKVYVNAVWPGDSVFPNFFLKKTRDWWSDLVKRMSDLGVRGIWTDMNEPASFKGPLPDDVKFPGDDREYFHKEIHNVYGHMMAVATYDGLKKYDQRRPFVITRASYSGTQKYSTFWTGDNQSIWAHLQASIPQLTNMGLSGYIFVGTDVGGFGHDTTKELLIRWVEAGIFAPLFRNHSSIGTRHQEPWVFDQETLDIYRKYLNLRYELLPYMYDLFYEHQTTGAPIMRPLVYHYQTDTQTHNINDEYLFGDKFLVAPVVEQGKTKKLVYLPMGKWINHWTKEIYDGNNYIIADAPLDTLPLFVKYNSIIPRYEKKNSINPSDRNKLILEIYGEEANYSHYLDDGESFKYLDGQFQIYNFDYKNGELTINLTRDYSNNYETIEIRRGKTVVTVSGKENLKINI